MEMMHPLVPMIGIPLILILTAALHFLLKGSKEGYHGGTRAANTRFVKNLETYKKLKAKYRALMYILEGSLLVSLIAVLFLIARPYRTESVTSGVKKRDIFLCMDVSTSIYKLNYDLVDTLEDVVRGMDGDRFGIAVYNTSTVIYVPMTDDYDFVISKLEKLKDYFELEKEYMEIFGDREYYSDLNDEEYEEVLRLDAAMEETLPGVLVNNANLGSSLIGEGLATTMYSFPRLGKDERTRIIIMATDNDESALKTPVIELPEAAELCAKNGITIFGLYPQQGVADLNDETDYDEIREELRTGVEKTNGKFYEVSEQLSVADVVADMQQQEAMAVKSVSVKRKVDLPEVPAIILMVGLIVMSGTALALKR